MKFSYKFSNLLGTVYRKGNLNFTPDGSTILSPVGNRISLFDLKNNRSETLPVECRMNIATAALSPDGLTLIVVDEGGVALLISLISKTVLYEHNFHAPVHMVKFSPDGKKFAITKDSVVSIFHAPGRTKEFNAFLSLWTYTGAYDETTCIDWTTDSRACCVGSKDTIVRVYGVQRCENLNLYSLGSHTDEIVGAFFKHDSLDLYSIGHTGQLFVWICDTALNGLIEVEKKGKNKDQEPSNEDANEDDDDDDDNDHDTNDKEKICKEQVLEIKKITYKRSARHKYKDVRGEGTPFARLTSAAFHKETRILVAGFEDGAFFLHEMPDFNLIHSLSISQQTITSISINKSGDWIGLGCSNLGQLLVWEWQSESYVLKQQGHFNNMSCLVYSPDGQYIVTGGDDGKVKLWNTSSGFCFVTFSEHNAGITGVAFGKNGQVVVSSSMDGTVRAFDLNRYRNFRTFTSPQPVQFSCLALDHSGEIICAGGFDTFDIFVWSMQTGRLLDILTGHEGPISSLSFSSTASVLVSASWDKTVKTWDVFENKGAKETLRFTTDVLAVTYRPDGKEVAVATLDACITFWDVQNAVQTGAIEGRHDLGYSRKETDKITAKKISAGKAFNAISYTADGKCVLAGGTSKNICIYSVEDQMLIKKFEVTCNLSFDGTEEYLNRRKMTQWGSLALVDDSEEVSISLPGVRKGDKSSRHWKPEVRVFGVSFSPTGRAWASTTTEGLVIYSLDHNLVFDPFDLDIDITPNNVKLTLLQKEYSKALMLAFRLNEHYLIQEVLESTPLSYAELLCTSLPDVYVNKLIAFIGGEMESSQHLEFYLTWCQKILFVHGPQLKKRSQSIQPQLRSLQKVLTRKFEDIGKICDHNRYTVQYLLMLAQLKLKRKAESEDVDDDSKETIVKQLVESNDIDAELPSHWESDSDDDKMIVIKT